MPLTFSNVLNNVGGTMVDLCVHQINGPMEAAWTSERLTHALVHMLHMLANASDNLLMAPPPHRLPPPLTFSNVLNNVGLLL